MSRAIQPILLATSNPKKIREIREIFEPIGLEVQSLDELTMDLTEPEETGDTFEANAMLKAVGYARQTGRVCLADDSGLEVDALDGQPGIMSARYCQLDADKPLTRSQRDELNTIKLLHELRGIPPEARLARFVCAMCVAAADSDGAIRAGLETMLPSEQPIQLATSRGTFEGAIGEPGEVPRGANGFGYDPVFLVAPECTSTSAELDPETKNAISHRGHAAREIAAKLRVLRTLQ